MEKTVLIYIRKDESYLMIYRNKKKKDINKNKYIGVGGHIEKDETPEEAVIREVKEETNLYLTSFQKRGILHFSSDGYEEIIYLYSGTADGVLGDCSEGELTYIPIKDIHKYPMWEGDYVFLDLLEKEKRFFIVYLTYVHDKLTYHRIEYRQ